MFPDHKKNISQVFEEFEGRITKKLSLEFGTTKNRILGALSRPDHFFMKPLVQGYAGTAPETSRSAYTTNQSTNEDDSQSDPHPDASIFQNRTTHNSRRKMKATWNTCFSTINQTGSNFFYKNQEFFKISKSICFCLELSPPFSLVFNQSRFFKHRYKKIGSIPTKVVSKISIFEDSRRQHFVKIEHFSSKCFVSN